MIETIVLATYWSFYGDYMGYKGEPWEMAPLAIFVAIFVGPLFGIFVGAIVGPLAGMSVGAGAGRIGWFKTVVAAALVGTVVGGVTGLYNWTGSQKDLFDAGPFEPSIVAVIANSIIGGSIGVIVGGVTNVIIRKIFKFE